MRCVLVEDDPIYCELIKKFIQEIHFLSIHKVFYNAKDCLDYLKDNKIELLILDVQLPDSSGYELIKDLTSKNEQIIVISSDEKNALLGYKYDIADFLLKPFDKTAFLESIYKAKEKLVESSKKTVDEEIIFIKSSNTFHRLRVLQILYIEVKGDYLRIETENGNYLIRDTLKDFSKKLPSNKFIRIHNSFIVNMNKIDKIEESMVIIGKKLIPIGRKYKVDFYKMLNL